MIAASAYPSSASSQFGSKLTKASRLHPLLAFVFAGLASTVATSAQAHYTLQTLAGTATEQRTEQTASGTNRLQSHSHTYKPAGSNASQTTTQDYPRDASGSLTRLGSQALQYNAQGRIAAATTAGATSNTPPAFTYQYNSSAQRLLKTDHRTSTTNTATPATEATLYADDATGSTVLGQYSNQRSTTSAAPAGEADSTEVLWLPTASGPMPMAAQINGRLYAIDSDHLNTPRRLTNAQGQVVWQWLITGYGEVAPTTGATGYAFEAPQLGGSSNTSGNVYSEEVNFKLRYPGQVWDEETGLSYNLNRYYDAQAGRYVQSDPIGLDGGWNRFAYVGGNPLNGTDPDGLNPFAVANFVTNIAVRGYGVAQTALYRYAPALTELVAGASGVNGAVVSPISPLVAQIPTTVSRMTPVARAVVEGIESGGFCAAQGVRGLSSHGGSFSSSINAAGGEVWTATGKIAQKDFVTYVNSGLYKGEVNIISGVHGTPAGATIADLSLFRADLARFGAIPGVRVHNFTEMTPKQLTDLLRGGSTTIGGFCDSGACLAPFK